MRFPQCALGLTAKKNPTEALISLLIRGRSLFFFLHNFGEGYSQKANNIIFNARK